jgi:glyoxylase-like metal-dependent hydrolase (beta-lactamase superfamily II)
VAAVLLRQLFDATSSTFTYLLADPVTREAALIDPVREQVERDVALLRELGLRLRYSVETHVHADHVTSATAIKERTGAKLVAGARGATCADVHLRGGETLELGSFSIRALETPGHTDDSLSYLCAGHVFTGDALLVRTCGRTDFQNGDPGTLFDSITQVLFALDDDTIICPAHDYVGFSASTIGEEKRWNERVAGRSRDEFIALMRGLHLPEPKLIHEAVPLNRACGQQP